jgi:ATP phosphoribosyltransferase regulatory subunit
LTVPACRYHLSHAKDLGAGARYCYSGPAFRFASQTQNSLNSSEFDQAGIEWFSAEEPRAAEAEVLHLALKAVEAAGLRNFRVRTGDLGLFRALLDSIAMPERWRSRLLHQFWRPKAFRDLLDLLTGESEKSRSSISPHVDAVASLDNGGALAYVEQVLASSAIPLTGRRSEEIASRLREKAQDRDEARLSPEARRRIDDYLDIGSPLDRTTPFLEPFAQAAPGFKAALDQFSLRMRELKRRRINLESAVFSAIFGRNLEYYTGFVFEIEADIAETTIQVAGGGRYDSLLADIGSPVAIPAVGCAIHTERLLAAVRGTP